MLLTPDAMLACPMDGLPLARSAQQWRCEKGHTYDIAREGYSNLLLVQHKASLDPGDSKDMVAARRRFLEAGYFAPIAERVYWMASGVLPSGSDKVARVLDAGCGEGFYLDRFAGLAAHHGPEGTLALAGIDVSKWAVKAAAKRKVPCTWAVASNRQPPFAAGSLDLIVCVFGFPVWEGFARVLAPGGRVLLVDPGPEHLIELRRVIYPSVKQTSAPAFTGAEAKGFRLESEEALLFKITVEEASRLKDLLLMTPHGHRIAPDRRAAAQALQSLDLTVDVTLRLVSRT